MKNKTTPEEIKKYYAKLPLHARYWKSTESQNKMESINKTIDSKVYKSKKISTIKFYKSISNNPFK